MNDFEKQWQVCYKNEIERKEEIDKAIDKEITDLKNNATKQKIAIDLDLSKQITENENKREEFKKDLNKTLDLYQHLKKCQHVKKAVE